MTRRHPPHSSRNRRQLAQQAANLQALARVVEERPGLCIAEYATPLSEAHLLPGQRGGSSRGAHSRTMRPNALGSSQAPTVSGIVRSPHDHASTEATPMCGDHAS